MASRAEEGAELLTLVRSLRERIDLDRRNGSRMGYLRAGQGKRSPADLKALPMAIPTAAPRVREAFPAAGSASVFLADIQKQLGDCQRCGLSRSRKKLVFGEGNPHASLVFVGEAPGADEDARGRPFVGPAGQLLTKIIEAMGLQREEVYLCNILKCHPPGNRNPKPEEIAACEPFLIRQLQAIQPQVICALGTFASHALLKSEVPISVLRGHFHSYQGIDLMPTYHPAYLLRNPGAKRQVWSDVRIIMKRLRGDQ